MAKTRPGIEEFDKLGISDLMRANSKELIIAIFIKVKRQNDKIQSQSEKLKWHDRFILGVITTIGLGITAGVILGIINFIFI